MPVLVLFIVHLALVKTITPRVLPLALSSQEKPQFPSTKMENSYPSSIPTRVSTLRTLTRPSSRISRTKDVYSPTVQSDIAIPSAGVVRPLSSIVDLTAGSSR